MHAHTDTHRHAHTYAHTKCSPILTWSSFLQKVHLRLKKAYNVEGCAVTQ